MTKTKGMTDIDRAQVMHSIKEEAEAKEFTETVSQFMNTMNKGRTKKAIELMLRDHPTLQQGMIRFIMLYIQGMSEKERFDGRNEASVTLAKKIMEIEDRFLPFI